MKTAVKQIFGNWDLGYALDKHSISSTPIGEDEHGHMRFETLRTEVGEAVFLLKYRSRWDQVEALAAAIHQTLCPVFPNVGLVIPMAASNPRARQPVNEVGDHLARMLGVKMFENILIKVPNGKSLKNLTGKAEKAEALKGTLSLNNEITNDGKWNVILIDDLYQSGASLEAACAVLRTYAKIEKIYVVALTWRY